MSDDLSKKRKKNIQKAVDIINDVEDTFSKAMKQQNLDQLYKRKFLLEGKLKDEDRCPVVRANNKLQLDTVNQSIELLESEGINLTDEYDIKIDEAAAREFLDKHNFFDMNGLIEQNNSSID